MEPSILDLVLWVGLRCFVIIVIGPIILGIPTGVSMAVLLVVKQVVLAVLEAVLAVVGVMLVLIRLQLLILQPRVLMIVVYLLR